VRGWGLGGLHGFRAPTHRSPPLYPATLHGLQVLAAYYHGLMSVHVRVYVCMHAMHVCACSAGIGDDVVSIASTSPDWGRDDSVMYIGVLGRYATVYNLTVTVRSLVDQH
jgi:hypothetical protein